MVGSLAVLGFALLVFIIATLAVGFAFSTFVRSQVRSRQLTMFCVLPGILPSGFLFPFGGMPAWAHWFGEPLPLMRFLRVVRAVMLKGAALVDALPQFWPIGLFTFAIGAIAMKRCRQTPDRRQRERCAQRFTRSGADPATRSSAGPACRYRSPGA